ncbi:hypothetical protein [Paraburkholderia guartelaensis]|nr:hypothetical protein [Paraburkholderia guartelaensis]
MANPAPDQAPSAQLKCQVGGGAVKDGSRTGEAVYGYTVIS